MDTPTTEHTDTQQSSAHSQIVTSPLTNSSCDSPPLTPQSNESTLPKNENQITEEENTSNSDDILILRKDPTTNRTVINKQAYLKLHKATRPNNRLSDLTLREKYQPHRDLETYLRSRNTYSFSTFRSPEDYNKIPVPKPRGTIKSESSILPSKTTNHSRLSFPFNVTKKDENSNNVFRKNSSSSGEFINIVTRSESEGSIDKLKSELDLFTMDERMKDKKRSNSFKKLFTGKIFSKDKKKKNEQELLREQDRLPCKENVVYSDNMKNETNAFNRHDLYRHTVGGGGGSGSQKEIKVYRNDSQRSIQKPNYDGKQLEQQYAQMHIDAFNQTRRNFENVHPPSEQYVKMDKPFITNNTGYTKMDQLSRYIDSSSSVSTLESERDTLYQNEVIAQAHRQYIQKQQRPPNVKQHQAGVLPNSKPTRFDEITKEVSRDTPPRAEELRQDVRLVNPKALIIINSERPLPNPYQNAENHSNGPTFRSNSHHSLRTINAQEQFQKNFLEDTYGTVFDSIDNPQKRNNQGLQRATSFRTTMKPLEPLRPPRPPSVESTKLKIPANREIIPLSPRMKSPIPQDEVSTEKIIATELLKSRTPTPTRKGVPKPLSPSHQKLEIAIDYPDVVKEDRSDNNSVRSEAISDRPSEPRSAKSPEATLHGSQNLHRSLISRISPVSPVFNASLSQTSVHRISAASPIPELQEKITTNAVVHVKSPSQTNLNHIRSLSPSARSITPIDSKSPNSISSQSPQKEEMRRNVEAFCWKELKRLKEQENMNLYYYQMQMMRTPNGYAEDPISTRRARSMSPTSQRNGRRSLSLPRDPRSTNQHSSRFQPNSIPEDRMLPNQAQLIFDYNTQQFRRNAPERRTMDAVPRHVDTNSLYRPIFKRGSLTTPSRDSLDDGQNKRVSFSSSKVDIRNPQSWPTKTGYNQSPPQRKTSIQDNDDVFLPQTNGNIQTSRLVVDGKEVYGYTNKPPTYAEYQQRQNEQYQSRQALLAQQRNLYDAPSSSTYAPAKPPRDSLYGPLVVANVRQQKLNNNSVAEPPYGPLVVTTNRPPRQINSPEETLYGQPLDVVSRVPQNIGRHGSIQLREPVYSQKPPLPRKMSVDSQIIRNDNLCGPRREIIMNDEIFGQFGGYIPPRYQNIPPPNRKNMGEQPVFHQQVNAPKQIQEPSYGYSRSGPRHVSVRNQVCDIYGQIHDRENPGLTPAHQRSGVVLGQLQNVNHTSRQQSYGHLPNENFNRNSRLTASANDMYRRYQNVDTRYRNEIYQSQQRQNHEDIPPNRPLPPVPTDKRLQNSDKSKSDNTLNGTTKMKKSKKRGFFGK